MPSPISLSRRALAAASVLLLAGCATAPKIVNTWQDPQYQGEPFRNVLVVGLTEKETNRRIFEDTFASILRGQGVKAQASYTLLADHRGYEREVIEQVVADGEFDGIITARVVGMDRETSYTGGYAMAYPSTAYYHDFYGFYHQAWGFYSTPGHVYTYDVVRVETTLYETDDWDLVWTGMTETVDPGKIQNESAKLANVILGELKNRGLI
jgi:hypothetical protein